MPYLQWNFTPFQKTQGSAGSSSVIVKVFLGGHRPEGIPDSPVTARRMTKNVDSPLVNPVPHKNLSEYYFWPYMRGECEKSVEDGL